MGVHILVVEAGAGGDFGPMTMKCLDQMDVMVAFCYEDYGKSGPALYYSGPYMYSETLRVNLTILASDDSGASFGRSLNLWPGSAGYTGLACGMPGKNDCGVLFSSHGVGLNFLSFSSNAVK